MKGGFIDQGEVLFLVDLSNVEPRGNAGEILLVESPDCFMFHLIIYNYILRENLMKNVLIHHGKLWLLQL